MSLSNRSGLTLNHLYRQEAIEERDSEDAEKVGEGAIERSDQANERGVGAEETAIGREGGG